MVNFTFRTFSSCFFFLFFSSKSLRPQILFHFVCPVQSVFSLFSGLWKHIVRFSMYLNWNKPTSNFSLVEVVSSAHTLLTVCPCVRTVIVTKMSFIVISICIRRHYEDESLCLSQDPWGFLCLPHTVWFSVSSDPQHFTVLGLPGLYFLTRLYTQIIFLICLKHIWIYKTKISF